MQPSATQALPGGRRSSTGAGGPGAPQIFELPPQRVLLPPTDYMPREAQPIQAFGEAAVTGAAAGVSWAIPAGLVYQLPPNDVGAIKVFFVSTRPMLATSSIVWSLRVNQAAVPGFGRVQLPTQGAAFVADQWGPQEVTVMLPKGALVDVLATVFDVATYTLSARYVGWHMDAAQWEAYKAKAGA